MRERKKERDGDRDISTETDLLSDTDRRSERETDRTLMLST